VPSPASEKIALVFVNMADVSNEMYRQKSTKKRKKVSWSFEEGLVITEWQRNECLNKSSSSDMQCAHAY
jgi:hypothetical protein